MRPRKTDLKKTVSKRKRRKVLAQSRLSQSIGEILEDITNNVFTFNDILDETDSLAILNKAKVNNFLNVYITKIFDSLANTEAINNRLIEKIMKKKELVPPQELTRLYIKTRELANDQLKLVTEFAKVQEVKLELEEQNMVIIYRSLPPNLKKLMYNTVMEFVRKCPAIQRELQKQKENVQGNQL